MIKTLLNADEDPPPGTKVVVEETILNQPTPPAETQPPEEIPATPDTAAVAETEIFEIPEDAKFFTRQPENAENAENAPAPLLLDLEEPAPLDEDAESLTALMSEIENLEPEELDRLEREIENIPPAAPSAEITGAPPTVAETVDLPPSETEKEAEKKVFEAPEEQTDQTPNLFGNSNSPIFSAETPEEKSGSADAPSIFQSDYTPPTTAETIRNSGLAWSAGIVFFGAVIFMMIFGWFADLLFGSSPWGLVGGIILGGIIGFIQFFRITSQIFKK